MMQHFHPQNILLLRDAKLRDAAEARTRHQVAARPVRRLQAAMLWRRHRHQGRFDPTWQLCTGLGDRDLQRFEDHFRVTEVEAGASLGDQGTPVKEFIVVLSGQVGVSIDGNIVQLLEPGAHFGSMQLLGDQPVPVRLASFVCLESVTLGTVRRPVLREIVERFPTVASHLRKTGRVRAAYFAGRTDADIHTPYPADLDLAALDSLQ